MSRPVAFTSLAISALILIVAAQNCAPGSFTGVGGGGGPAPSEAPGTNNEAGGPDGTDEPVTGIPTDGTNPDTPVMIPDPGNPGYLPKIAFDYKMCSDYSDCTKTMTLSRVHDKSIYFKWKTSEAAASVRPEVFCQPDLGYVPAKGELTYQPGETDQTIMVRSLSCGSDKQIPLNIYDCKQNGVAFNCMDLI